MWCRPAHILSHTESADLHTRARAFENAGIFIENIICVLCVYYEGVLCEYATTMLHWWLRFFFFFGELNVAQGNYFCVFVKFINFEKKSIFSRQQMNHNGIYIARARRLGHV